MRAMWQILLAAALGMGVFAGLARAGNPGAKSVPAVVTEVIEETPGGDAPAKKRLQPRPAKDKGTVGDWWRNHTPLLCYSHFNDYSCGGVHSEFFFHFGSCRQFFGERCVRGLPPSPVPGFDPSRINPPRGSLFSKHGGTYNCPFCR